MLEKEKKEELEIVSKEIKEIVAEYQKEHDLSFVEDTHTYYIRKDGEIKSDMPSVSTVLHSFYTQFDATTTKAFKKCGGDPVKEAALLQEWADTGTYASSTGSRVHFLLESYLVDMYGSYKEVRIPIFDCDEEQIRMGDGMIEAGKKFIDLMHERGAILLDTEMVLGNVELGYFGQNDKAWVMFDKNNNPGILITDWKTNKYKNFQVQPWTKKMLEPFTYLDDTALGHYNVQLPLYGKLLLKMLEGTKYENIPLLGCIIVHVSAEGEFEEFRVPRTTMDIIMDMTVKDYLH